MLFTKHFPKNKERPIRHENIHNESHESIGIVVNYCDVGQRGTWLLLLCCLQLECQIHHWNMPQQYKIHRLRFVPFSSLTIYFILSSTMRHMNRYTSMNFTMTTLVMTKESSLRLLQSVISQGTPSFYTMEFLPCDRHIVLPLQHLLRFKMVSRTA